MLENVRKNAPDFYHAWRKYCAVKNWREAGRHVDWTFEKDGDTLWVYFRGSDERVDWLRDCMAIPTVLFPYFTRFAHYGFARSLNDLFNDELFIEYLFAPYRIILIGYSSGGAIALLVRFIYQAASDVLGISSCTDNIQVYTFAAPRVAWARPLPPQPGTVNVRLSGDPIPHLPPRWLGWQDNPGQEVVLPSKFGFRSHQPAAYSEAIGRVDK